MKKLKKKRKLKKWLKITIIIFSSIIVALILIFMGHKIYTKYNNKDTEFETVVKEELKVNNFSYYINNNSTKYEKETFNELKKILSNEEINEEEYAKALTKVFISNLFTLSSKNSSSDISSSQYVYSNYQETYKTIIKDTIYSSIELNLNGERKQTLPEVNNVEITSIDRIEFSLNNNILDKQAFSIEVNISYTKDLGYPTNYKIIIVKNNELLEIAKAG